MPVTNRNYEIERGVPVPAITSPKDRGFTATLRAMGVGDSVVLPTTASTLHNIARRLSGKFTVRKEGAGFRVWRVA